MDNEFVNIFPISQFSPSPPAMASQDNTSPTPEPSETQLFAPQPDSPFFIKFPGELRNRIYRLALLDDDDIAIHVALNNDHQETQEAVTGVTSPVSSRTSIYYLNLGHPLLQVCKQIRHEASDIYYMENTFEVTTCVFETPRALEKLGLALRPWAAKIATLSVTHHMHAAFGTFQRRLHMLFKISRRHDRLVIWGEESLYWPGPAWYVQEPATIPEPVAVADVCTCKLDHLASENATGDVVQFLQRYAATIPKALAEATKQNTFISRCWACTHLKQF